MLKPFVCPRCNGKHFGTLNATAKPADLIIECHDEHGTRCRWVGRWADVQTEPVQVNAQPVANTSTRPELWIVVGNEKPHPSANCYHATPAYTSRETAIKAAVNGVLVRVPAEGE